MYIYIFNMAVANNYKHFTDTFTEYERIRYLYTC